jgi:hypothetical protein
MYNYKTNGKDNQDYDRECYLGTRSSFRGPHYAVLSKFLGTVNEIVRVIFTILDGTFWSSFLALSRGTLKILARLFVSPLVALKILACLFVTLLVASLGPPGKVARGYDHDHAVCEV